MDEALRVEVLNPFLLKHGLAEPEESSRWSVLAGGVSSDIWRVDLPGRSLCVKRALPKLNVAAEWQAPVSRNTSEWNWLCFAARHHPEHVPKPLAHDSSAGLFAMQFLPPDRYPIWKQQLMRGEILRRTATAVGTVLGQLHAASARDLALARDFDTYDNFFALRLEPYLIATSKRHSALADQLTQLARRTAETRIALVHGDVSPKNILVGPNGPVFLDAECAWYGDPAFDLAFCLNHLLLKCLVRRTERHAYLESFAALSEAYFRQADWEQRAALEARAASLLPGLFLARVDGKSPVEYLTCEQDKSHVRAFATRLLKFPLERLSEVATAWRCVLDATAPTIAAP
jgi:aminoglycoside phosphotransferase (APT) family kinase protein